MNIPSSYLVDIQPFFFHEWNNSHIIRTKVINVCERLAFASVDVHMFSKSTEPFD